MDKKLICENKYEYIYETIGLDVKLKSLPSELFVKDQTLFLQPDFHVSLVCIGKIIERYNISIPDFLNKIIEDFCNFSKTNEIKIVSCNNEYKFVDRNDTKKTIVVMCEILNINNFFDQINKKYKLEIEYPTTHITLYNTLKNQPGIFLMESSDINNFTIPIPNPIGFYLQF